MRLPRLNSPVIKTTASALEYVIVLVLLVGGLQTGLQAAYPQVTTDRLQEIFGGRVALGLYGLTYFVAGAGLLWAKFRNRIRVHGIALMITYMLSLFGFILEIQVFNSPFLELLDTLLLTIVSGLLYLRYKYLTR